MPYVNKEKELGHNSHILCDYFSLKAIKMAVCSARRSRAGPGLLLKLTMTGLLFLIKVHPGSCGKCSNAPHIDVNLGDSAELTCTIYNESKNIEYYNKIWSKKSNGASTTVYTYLKNESGTLKDAAGASYISRASRISEDVVILTGVTAADEGMYSCSWEVDPNIPGCIGVSEDFNIKVIIPVSDVRIQVPAVREDEDVTFICTSKGSQPISYRWSKAGGTLPGGGRWQDMGDGRIILTKVQKSDAGSYQCRADNAAKKPQSSEKAHFEVYYAPSEVTLTTQPPNVRTVAENTSVTLTCESTGGEPSPTLAIIRDKVPLETRITSARRVVAAVRLDRFDDQKTFVCSAMSLGIDGSLDSAGVTYNVHYPPNVAVRIVPKNLAEGDATTLSCETSGGSPADITLDMYEWSIRPDFSSDQRIISGRQRIQLAAVSYKDVGVYTCRILKHKGGAATASQHLQVKYRAVWDPAVAASSVVAVSVGDSSEITLSVIAYLQPTFTWRRISVRGEEDLSAQVSNKGLTSTLGLTNVTEEDLSYRFVCDVANDVGTTRFNFTLIRQSAAVAASSADVGTIVGVSVAVIVALALTVFFVFKCRQQKIFDKKNGKETNKRFLSEEMDLMNSNITASNDFPVYAEVMKDKKKATNHKTAVKPHTATETVAAENAYQNMSEIRADAEQNEYQNPKDLQQQQQMHPQIKGPGGIVYEDPRNFDFGETAANKTSKTKASTEPTEYAEIHFQK